jgi:hypothetical protein
MSKYLTDRAWSDVMIPQIFKIVGPLLLEPAPFEMDVNQATDLLLFKAKDMRIAARIRRPGYCEKYPHEFTIRSHRQSGAETEMRKIINGFGDWMFYGHADRNNIISRWFLIDLHAFRAALISCDRLQYTENDNWDGTRFIAFDVRYFPESPPLLVASSHEYHTSNRSAVMA